MLVLAAFWLIPIGAVLLAGWLAARDRSDRFATLRELPESRWAPIAAGIITALVIWYVWGGMLTQAPLIHDEASYLLQAETFARGRWSMPSPPIPAFFEQFHVLVTPTFASKYPPGHAILLVPGIWLGLPGLVPLLLNALAGGLLFALARRVANAWVALLTFLLWLTLITNLEFRPSYFSENTTSALWLLGWWAILEWTATGRERWLAAVSACVGWMAITRPVTAVAFALPIVIFVLSRVLRQREWRVLVRPALIGLAILALLPLWSARTIGTWRTTPYSLYSKIYFPFDRPGFGLDSTPPRRELPPDMRKLGDAFAPFHARYTPREVPRALLERWSVLALNDAFAGWRLPLLLFAILGLAVLSPAGWFALGSSVLLTLCYLSYAHQPDWTLYYLEITPLLPFLTASGIWAVWALGARRGSRIAPELVQVGAAGPRLASVLLGILLLVPGRAQVVRMHRGLASYRQAHFGTFASAIGRLPDRPSIVFIRYAPGHDANASFIANEADLSAARTWFVYDRGPENGKLLARAPDRAPYLFDEASGTLTRLAPYGTAPAASASMRSERPARGSAKRGS